MAQPDVIAFLREVLMDEVFGTAADVPIRGGRAEPEDTPPFVVLEEAGALRSAYLPAYLPFRVGITCFGNTEKDASDLYRSITDVLHGMVNRRSDDQTVGMWQAQDETGPQPRDQAETRWPARYGVMALWMPDTILDS